MANDISLTNTAPNFHIEIKQKDPTSSEKIDLGSVNIWSSQSIANTLPQELKSRISHGFAQLNRPITIETSSSTKNALGFKLSYKTKIMPRFDNQGRLILEFKHKKIPIGISRGDRQRINELSNQHFSTVQEVLGLSANSDSSEASGVSEALTHHQEMTIRLRGLFDSYQSTYRGSDQQSVAKQTYADNLNELSTFAVKVANGLNEKLSSGSLLA